MEIICYLSNGYPTIEASYNMAVEYADAGCRMLEVDFPSRNPYLESDYIAGRMKKHWRLAMIMKNIWIQLLPFRRDFQM